MASKSPTSPRILSLLDKADTEYIHFNYLAAEALYLQAIGEDTSGWALLRCGTIADTNDEEEVATRYFNQALPLLQQTVEKVGCPRAQIGLGLFYEFGFGPIVVDKAEAARYYTMAAEQGFPLGQFNLGNMYDGGLGVEENKEKAVQLWQLAAARGHTGAIFNLGNMYTNGEGVQVNIERAIAYYTAAAEKGHRDAMFNLACMFEQGEGVPANPTEAERLWKKAAEIGDMESCYWLGVLYEEEENLSEAIKYYKTSAEKIIESKDQLVTMLEVNLSAEEMLS